MIIFKECNQNKMQELSIYLLPIWYEVYDELELGGHAAAEFMFSKWASPEALTRSLEEGYVNGFLENDGIRIGAYSYRIEESGDFYLSKLYLAPESRGKGFGREALSLMEKTALAHGCRRMYLSVLYHNKSAIRAYEKAGFDLEYRCLKYLGNGTVQNDCVMQKILSV